MAVYISFEEHELLPRNNNNNNNNNESLAIICDIGEEG